MFGKRLACVILASLFLLVSCTKNNENKTNVEKLKNGELILQENKNEINLGVCYFDTLNPILTKSASVSEFMKTVCEPLFDFDEAYNPIEVLGKNYQISEDAKTVSFELADVRFHDSKKLSPEDVIYTVNMIKSVDSIYSDCVKNIRNIYSNDSGRVYINLNRPVMNFIGMLSFPIVEEQTPKKIDSEYIPIGTGPYKYAEKRNSTQIVFTQNQAWNDGEQGCKNIIVNVMKDAQTLVNAFDSGEIDVLNGSVIGDGISMPGCEYKSNDYVMNRMTFLGINNNRKKLSGKYTRQALNILCEKEKIVDVEVFSKGVATELPINPDAWFYPEQSERERDYKTVIKLLENDGWEHSEKGYFRYLNDEVSELTLSIIVNEDNEEKKRIANNISASFNSFGITTSVKECDFKSYKEIIKGGEYDLFIGEVNLDSNMDPSYLTASSGNYFGYENDETDRIVKAMQAKNNTQSLREAVSAYAVNFMDEQPFVPLFFRKQCVIYNVHMSGITKPNFYRNYRDIEKWYLSKS